MIDYSCHSAPFLTPSRASFPAVILVALALLGVGCSDLELSGLNRGDSDSAPPAYEGDDPLDSSDTSGSGNTSTDDDDAGGEPTDGVDETEGVPKLVETDPAPDSTEHHYRAPLSVTFDGNALGAEVVLEGPVDTETGVSEILPTTGEWNDSYTHLVVRPTQKLEPLTTYSVIVELAGAAYGYGFTTSDVGTPLVDDSTIDGQTYALSLDPISVYSPSGLEAFLAPLGSGALWLLNVQMAPGDVEMGVDLAPTLPLSEEDVEVGASEQDPCSTVTAVGGIEAAVSWSNPYFSSGAQLFELELGEHTLLLEEGLLDGDFTPDGQGMSNVGLQGWLRAESLGSMLGDSTVCTWMEDTFGQLPLLGDDRLHLGRPWRHDRHRHRRVLLRGRHR